MIHYRDLCIKMLCGLGSCVIRYCGECVTLLQLLIFHVHVHRLQAKAQFLGTIENKLQ